MYGNNPNVLGASIAMGTASYLNGWTIIFGVFAVALAIRALYTLKSKSQVLP